MTTVDPTDSVRRVLKGAKSPWSTAHVVKALERVHDEREVILALDFWRREHAVLRDAEGKWSWQGTAGDRR